MEVTGDSACPLSVWLSGICVTHTLVGRPRTVRAWSAALDAQNWRQKIFAVGVTMDTLEVCAPRGWCALHAVWGCAA
jgi:hypothetical protein